MKSLSPQRDPPPGMELESPVSLATLSSSSSSSHSTTRSAEDVSSFSSGGGLTTTAATPSMESLAQDGQWKTLLDVVHQTSVNDWKRIMWENNRQTTKRQSSSHNRRSHHYSGTPLHVALAYRAPCYVMEALLDSLKNTHGMVAPELVQDRDGFTPLHVAVAAGCQEDIVKRLLSTKNDVLPQVPLTLVRDEQDRTPLHVACATPAQLSPHKSIFGSTNTLSVEKWHKCRVIAVLVEHSGPDALSMEDIYDKTPLDYLREQNLSSTLERDLRRQVKCLNSSFSSSSKSNSSRDTETQDIAASPDKKDAVDAALLQLRQDGGSIPTSINAVPAATETPMVATVRSTSSVSVSDNSVVEESHQAQRSTETSMQYEDSSFARKGRLTWIDVLRSSCNCSCL